MRHSGSSDADCIVYAIEQCGERIAKAIQGRETDRHAKLVRLQTEFRELGDALLQTKLNLSEGGERVMIALSKVGRAITELGE